MAHSFAITVGLGIAAVAAVAGAAPSGLARADDAVAPPAAQPASDAGDSAGKKPDRSKKGRHLREKETIQGTEARDRFQADTVLKSKYQLNGEQLEVDPD